MGGSRKLDANKVSDPDLERLIYVRYIRANIMGKTKRNTTYVVNVMIIIFEEFGNQLDVLSRLSSEPSFHVKKGPFLRSNDFDAKHESEHSVNSSFKQVLLRQGGYYCYLEL